MLLSGSSTEMYRNFTELYVNGRKAYRNFLSVSFWKLPVSLREWTVNGEMLKNTGFVHSQYIHGFVHSMEPRDLPRAAGVPGNDVLDLAERSLRSAVWTRSNIVSTQKLLAKHVLTFWKTFQNLWNILIFMKTIMLNNVKFTVFQTSLC